MAENTMFIMAEKTIHRKGNECIVQEGEVYEVLQKNEYGMYLIVAESGKKRWVHESGFTPMDMDMQMFA